MSAGKDVITRLVEKGKQNKIKLSLGALVLVVSSLAVIYTVDRPTTEKQTSEKTNAVKTEVVTLSADLKDISQGRDKVFQLSLKNDSDVYGKLTYRSADKYVYTIKSSDNTVIVSNGKVSTGGTVLANERVDPQGVYTLDIDISKEYRKLRDGNYMLEVRPNADEAKTLIVGLSFVKRQEQEKQFATEDIVFDKFVSEKVLHGRKVSGKENIEITVGKELGVMVGRLKSGEKIKATYELSGDDNVLRAFEKL